MMKENKNKPNLYNSKEKPPCPFCKERYENMKVDGQGILEHESEKFFWVNNKFPVIADYVLSKFSKDDQVIVKEAIEKSCDAVETALAKPFLEVMNQFNGA